MHLSEIHLRDPFILPDPATGKYYLFGTNCDGSWGPRVNGFQCFTSPDLETWDGPFPAFTPPPNFWAERDFWAPEVHRYRDQYYLFGSVIAAGVERGTQLFVAETPGGPYRPHTARPITPADWTCLDGTLHVDETGTPWIVFCHEWVQIHDGTICAMPLTPDLLAPAGEPVTLFAASSAPWVASTSEKDRVRQYVTDGPFVYRAANGELLLLWASFQHVNGHSSYTQGVARSLSGKITGPWQHVATPMYTGDGGHGMLFRTFDGRLMLTLHQPNGYPHERPLVFPVTEDQGILQVVR